MSYNNYGIQGISTGYGTYTQPTGGFMAVKVTFHADPSDQENYDYTLMKQECYTIDYDF